MRKKILLPIILLPFLIAGCNSTGPQGPKGDQGIPGEKGEKGETGVSILKVEKTSSEGKTDTYTITFSDGTTSNFNIVNGQDGKTPSITIGANGNWFIDNVDTEKSAKGIQGNPGNDGVSILTVQKTSTSGNVDTYKITYSNSNTSTFTVTNGVDGKDGASVLTGNGEPSTSLGKDGDSYIDIDSWDYYVKSNGLWSKTGNIKGAQGQQGIPGKDGSSVHVGYGMPDSDLGNNGDSFIDLNNWNFFIKEDNSWTYSGNISYRRKYTVKFMYGEEEIANPKEVEPNSRIPLPTVTRYKGQPITYWYAEGYPERPWEFDGYYADRVVDNVTLFANVGDLTLTLDPSTGGSVNPASIDVSFDKPYSLPIPTTTAKRDGYSLVFDHWSCNGEEIPLSGDTWSYGAPDNDTLVAEYHYGDDYTEAMYNLSLFEGTYQIDKVKDASKTGAYYIPSTYLNIPVTRIDRMAFDSTAVSSVDIPDSITDIGYDAFSMCSNLTSLSIPKSVVSISGEIASYCTSLTTITVDPDNESYDSRDNCNAIIETETNTLIQGCKSTVIPDTVEIIHSHAFNSHSTLTSINIPESVTKIEGWAFVFCKGLTSIYIPKTVIIIEMDVFLACENLTIYCEVESKPEGWNEEWVGDSKIPVYWGVSPNK